MATHVELIYYCMLALSGYNSHMTVFVRQFFIRHQLQYPVVVLCEAESIFILG